MTPTQSKQLKVGNRVCWNGNPAEKLYRPPRNEAGRTCRSAEIGEMTGDQSRLLDIGDRVCWQNDPADQDTVIEKNWSGVTIKWDSRGLQVILHNDMVRVERVLKKLM